MFTRSGAAGPKVVVMTHVDLHLHLLPGVDDGAPDEAAALAHAERMVAAGIREAAVTPHVGHPAWVLEPLAVRPRVAALQRALERAGIPLRLHAGGELHASVLAELTDGELAALALGPPGARWVLAEAPFAGIDEPFVAALARLRRRGAGAVIAHPERAAGLLDGGLARLRPALGAGAVLQVNTSSLLGRHGEEAADAARRLVRGGLAYLVASDGHPGSREDLLTAAGVPARLTAANPRFLLRHGLPSVPRAGRTGREVEQALRAARRLSRAS